MSTLTSTEFDGKVALVTGAGRNIGRQICLTLAEHGCDVVVHVGSNRQAGEAVCADIEARGRRALLVVADVSRPAEVAAMVDETGRRLGRLDILVNNAAIRPRAAFLELTEEDWHRVLGVNLHGPFYCCKAAVPLMVARGSGCIVNISGTASFDGGHQDAHIVASKAGLHGLTKALAVELGEFGIRVNTVVLGTIEQTQRPPGPSGRPVEAIPLRRRGSVHDAASTCAFLASAAAAYITGQAIHVNGGSLLA